MKSLYLNYVLAVKWLHQYLGTLIIKTISVCLNVCLYVFLSIWFNSLRGILSRTSSNIM